MSVVSATPTQPKRRAPRKTSKQLGRYRLAFELASGGMATVYLACARGDASVDRVVALKQIHPHLAREESYVQMFLDEARIASRIHHANACGVVDFGEADGDYFLVMEYVVGVPVNRLAAAAAKKIAKPDMRWAQIASRMVVDAAEGLHAAHELKGPGGELLDVVHRDISPQNLLAGFDGAVRVVDFGIAKAAGKVHKTATGELKGKFAYMAPEQIKQDSVLDRRADVWALGVVLWELLTLRRLFRRQHDADTMYAALEAPIPPPSKFNPDVPEELDELVLRAIHRSVDARVPDTRTLSRELQRVWARHAPEPVTQGDVGDKLRELFPGDEERQLELIEIARAADDVVPRVAIAKGGTDSFVGHGDTGPAEPITKIQRRAQRGPLIMVLIVALLGGFGTAAGFLLGAESSETGSGETPSVDPPDLEPATPDPMEPPVVAAEPVEEPLDEPLDELTEEPVDEPIETAEPEAPPPRPNPTRRARRRVTRPSTTEEPPAQTEPAPVAQEGTVAVVVPGGWANVYDARGRLLGVTPLRTTMPAGSQRLELRFFGNPPAVPVTVNVPAGGVARVSRPAPASE